MKVQDWKMQPIRKSARKSKSGDRPREEIQVQTMVAMKDDKRVILHRVEKTLPDGKKEVFIIKASPKEMEINH